MGHTVQHKKRLLHRIRRIRGQVEAVERSLVEERGCAEVMLTLAAGRGAIHALMVELMAEHLHSHVVHAAAGRDREKGAREIEATFRRALR
jgi:DNA-binding FrmR family transcriptional regulator